MVNYLTEDKIAALQNEKAEAAMREVLEADSYEPLETDAEGVTALYQAGDKGYVVRVSVNGFGGAIDMMVGISADGTVTETAVQFDAAGTASVRLRAGERLSLTGIPTDAAWRVEEDHPGSYRVSVSVDGGTAEDAASAEGTALGRGSAVVFTNEAVYTLPETGGAGTFPFAVGGLLAAAAAALLLRNRKKRGKEEPPSS